MFAQWLRLATAALALLAGIALAFEMSEESFADELQMGWKMGLRPRQSSENLQFFTGSVGGASAPAISKSSNPDRPFQVEGDTFPDFNTAADRACDTQKNACAEAANNGGSHQVSDCDQQNDKCKSGISTATKTTFDNNNNNGGGNTAQPERALVSSDANFDYFCDV
ncbi:hypothetical protein F5X68DRAFT_272446 [Plectosphaerella plurivora]|uniref:Uncharacterized protein n=1 Tax=Plectosphaerella plurivora TaxID=936078 RepID=A0A9P8VPW9_9PEZI|nr:hypothetical protein F5X68DRAFT_272446 [Plectosphaerella plurivora]